jgi:hypothetical protein
MTNSVSVPVLSVEERLRVCLTLTKGLYHFVELVGEHELAALEGFEPSEAQRKVPQLTRALRDQLVAVRAALSFECLSREAPVLAAVARAPLAEAEAQQRELRDSRRLTPPRKGGAR